MEDEFFGNVSLYYDQENPYTLKCRKSLLIGKKVREQDGENSNLLKIEVDGARVEFLSERIKRLPSGIYPISVENFELGTFNGAN